MSGGVPHESEAAAQARAILARTKIDAIPTDASKAVFVERAMAAFREFDPRLSSRSLGLIAGDLWRARLAKVGAS